MKSISRSSLSSRVKSPFRVILIIGMVAVMPFGIYHRVRSQSTGETLDRRQEGWFILLTLRPISLAAIVGLMTFVINPDLMAWYPIA